MRRWVSDRAVTAAVVWHLRKTNLNGAGVSGHLFLNGEEIDTATIAGNDGVGVTQVVQVDLDEGDIVELAHTPVGPGGDTGDGSDGSANWMRVLQSDGGPPVGTVFHRGDADASGAIKHHRRDLHPELPLPRRRKPDV